MFGIYLVAGIHLVINAYLVYIIYLVSVFDLEVGIWFLFMVCGVGNSFLLVFLYLLSFLYHWFVVSIKI